MKLAQLYRKYLRGCDLTQAITVEIAGMKLVTVQPHPSAPPQEKWCLFVTGLPEDLPNSILVGPKAVEQLVSIFGNIETKEMQEQKVVVFPLKIKIGNVEKVGIRFRKFEAKPQKPAAPKPPQDMEEPPF